MPTRREHAELPVAKRTGFDEVVAGLSETEARYEATRCLSCGNCFECDNCYASCPEQAIVKLGKGRFYRFDYDLCTGCAVCFEQCPCHAIEMTPEPAGANGVHARTDADVDSRAIDVRHLEGAPDVREVRRHGWQHGGRPHRLPRQRGLRDLPDHAVVDDGRAGRRVGRGGHQEHLGQHPGRFSRCSRKAAPPAPCMDHCKAVR